MNQLTQDQIQSIIQQDGQTFRTSYGSDKNPLTVQLNRWTKGDTDRLYINKISGGGLARDFGQSVGFIDLITGEIHGDNWHNWMQRVREGVVDEILEG